MTVKKKKGGVRKKKKMEQAAAELMAGPKKGEVGPVWVKSSPIISMDESVSLQNPGHEAPVEQAFAAIAIQDDNFRLHEMVFGKNNTLTVALGERIIKGCNQHGTSLLGLGDVKTALAMFKKAAEILGRMPTSAGDYATKLELRCLTYSNLAWYYFCTKEYYPALQYAQKAQSSANVSQDQRAMAAAHLNIGCCVSMLGCHDGALDHATKALYLLQAERGGSGANSAVAVCLHNIAVEQIQLFRSGENIGAGEALETCTDAIEIAKEVLDPNHAWMRHFRRTFKVAVKMSPSVDALRKSQFGPLRRVRSASPQLFDKGHRSTQHPYKDEESEDFSLPPVQGAQSAQGFHSTPMRDTPLDTPPPAIPVPRRLQKTRIAPPGKLPTLPKNLQHPHAFNPSGGEVGSPGEEEEEEEGEEVERPASRASLLGLGGTLKTGNLMAGGELNSLVRRRAELIKTAGNTQAIPRLMSPTGYAEDDFEEEHEPEPEPSLSPSPSPSPSPLLAEEGMKVTATSSAAVVETGIVDPSGVEEEDPYAEEFEEDVLSPKGAEEEEEDPYADEYEEEDFEDASPTAPKGGEVAAATDTERDEAARRIQRIARGKQGRKKVQAKREWKASQSAWTEQADADREKAASQIQRVARGKQGRKKAKAESKSKAESKTAAHGHMRSDLGDGGEAAMEMERQRAVLKIQALQRGKAQRAKVKETKAKYDASPELKPQGYKAYSEYDGEGKDNPYFVKLNKGGKKKRFGQAGEVYRQEHVEASRKIQAIQRGKASKKKVREAKAKYEADPDSAPQGVKNKAANAEEYEAKLKAGKKGKKA